MILRNNSKNEWLNYVAGIDILPESTFEVPEKEGKFILRLLGHENWVVEVGSDEVIEKIKEIETVVVDNDEINIAKTVMTEEDLERSGLAIEGIKVEEVKMKRTEIMKVLKENGIKFTVKMSNDELLALLK